MIFIACVTPSSLIWRTVQRLYSRCKITSSRLVPLSYNYHLNMFCVISVSIISGCTLTTLSMSNKRPIDQTGNEPTGIYLYITSISPCFRLRGSGDTVISYQHGFLIFEHLTHLLIISLGKEKKSKPTSVHSKQSGDKTAKPVSKSTGTPASPKQKTPSTSEDISSSPQSKPPSKPDDSSSKTDFSKVDNSSKTDPPHSPDREDESSKPSGTHKSPHKSPAKITVDEREKQDLEGVNPKDNVKFYILDFIYVPPECTRQTLWDYFIDYDSFDAEATWINRHTNIAHVIFNNEEDLAKAHTFFSSNKVEKLGELRGREEYKADDLRDSFYSVVLTTVKSSAFNELTKEGIYQAIVKKIPAAATTVNILDISFFQKSKTAYMSVDRKTFYDIHRETLYKNPVQTGVHFNILKHRSRSNDPSLVKLWVGGITIGTTDKVMTQDFVAAKVPVCFAHVIKDKDGACRGFGYLWIDNPTYTAPLIAEKISVPIRSEHGRHYIIKNALNKDELVERKEKLEKLRYVKE